MKRERDNNKLAWEQAFDRVDPKDLERLYEQLKHDPRAFLSETMKRQLGTLVEQDRSLAQFCCNNGRETISALSLGFKQAVGYDIAANMVDFANQVSDQLGVEASFVQADMLELKTNERYDVGFLTVGSLTWFDDLHRLFKRIAQTIETGGFLLIEDIHPIMNMVAIPGEANYEKTHPRNLVNDYNRKEPWVESDGMYYMAKHVYASHPFASYSYTFADLINGLIDAGFAIEVIVESTTDRSEQFTHLNDSGVPLTLFVRARRL